MSDATEKWSDTQVALVDLIDRVIGGGVVITGEVVLGVAGVDLVYLGLQLVLAPAHEVEQSVALRGRSA
jgi:Gas vesicle protein